MLKMFQWLGLIAAIVLVLAGAGAIVSLQPSQEPPKQHATQNNYKEQTKEKNNETLFDRWFPDSISVYTLFLVVFTGVLAFGGLYQLSLLARAERVATTAAEAAKDSADAARDAVKLSDKTAERQLRAYLYVFPVAMIGFQPNKPPAVSLSMKNHGITPLRNGYVHYGFAIAANDPDNDYFVAKNTMISSKAPLVLAGNGEPMPIRLEGDKLLSQDDFLKVTAGTHVIIIGGIFTYDDIFGFERHTGFNYAFSWAQMKAVQDMAIKDGYVGGAGPATYCKTGNDVD